MRTPDPTDFLRHRQVPVETISVTLQQLNVRVFLYQSLVRAALRSPDHEWGGCTLAMPLCVDR